MDMLDFNCKIYEKELEYGIYFLLRRKKESPKTTLLKIEYLQQHYFHSQATQDTKQENN